VISTPFLLRNTLNLHPLITSYVLLMPEFPGNHWSMRQLHSAQLSSEDAIGALYRSQFNITHADAGDYVSSVACPKPLLPWACGPTHAASNRVLDAVVQLMGIMAPRTICIQPYD